MIRPASPHHFLPLRSCFILDFSAKCMLGRHGLWFLFRKIFCKKSHKLDGKNLIFIFFFVYFAAVCLLPSEFLLQKNFFDMVPGFDQTQIEKMQFLILFHNIYSNYKPRNHEYTNNIFEKNFLSPSWRHGPQNSFLSFVVVVLKTLKASIRSSAHPSTTTFNKREES